MTHIAHTGLYIPTWKRVGRQHTLAALAPACEAIGMPLYLVIRPEEEGAHHLPHGAQELVLPEGYFARLEGGMRLTNVCQYLHERAPTRYILRVDDDLRFSYRANQDDTTLTDKERVRLTGLEPGDRELEKMLGLLHTWLAEGRGMVGVSMREGQNRHPEPVKRATRICRFFGWDMRLGRTIRFNRLGTFDDFDPTLMFLRSGGENWITYRYAQDQIGGSNAEGGCSVYRDYALQKAAAEGLAELHPGFVTVVRKPVRNWSGWGEDHRYDVRIQWRKAAEAGATANAEAEPVPGDTSQWGLGL